MAHELHRIVFQMNSKPACNTHIMRIFIDCTDTYNSGMNTGIQRVVRNFVRQATVLGPSLGVACTPVIFKNGVILPLASLDALSLHSPRDTLRGCLNRTYLSTVRRIAAILPYPSVRRFLLAHRSQFGLAWLLYSPLQLVAWLSSLGKPDQPPVTGIEGTLGTDDMLFLADATWETDFESILTMVKEKGTPIVFFVHDIIPLTHPEIFHSAHLKRFHQWFLCVIRFGDFLVFNSHFTQQTFVDYFARQHGSKLPTSAVVHLGYDLVTVPDGGIRHSKLRHALTRLPSTCLCVGTLEPRKNLNVLIDAFELLWSEGEAVKLILIGRAGWLCEELLLRIRRHPERGNRLFWFDDVGDTDLALAYRQASTLIFPSIVEGFGLPLVEALSQGLPVIASDIPVFREIAGDHARFFPPHDAVALASTVRKQLAAPSTDSPPSFRWLTWEESARQLLSTLRTFAGG
jgi:glycosyltransferase involved in cell wall biosynthesis